MYYLRKINLSLIASSFLVAIFLTIIPLPEWGVWARPQWVLAVLLYWVFTMPAQCGVILAWCAGLLMDLITGTTPGQQAFIFVFLAYFVLKYHLLIAHFPLWERSGVIALFALTNVLFQSGILKMTGHSTHIELYSLSALTTFLVWPLISIILDRLQPKVFTKVWV